MELKVPGACAAAAEVFLDGALIRIAHGLTYLQSSIANGQLTDAPKG